MESQGQEIPDMASGGPAGLEGLAARPGEP